MACTTPSMTIESYPEHAATSATPSEGTFLRDRRRRHSFHTARRLSYDYDGDAVFLRVSTLSELWLSPV